MAIGSNCFSSMHDIGAAISIYESDNDDSFPVGRTSTGPTGLGWAGRLGPYLHNPGINLRLRFHDPADVDDGRISYALNANVSATPKTALVTDGARSVLLFEIEGAELGGMAEFGEPVRLSPVGDGSALGLRDCLDPEVAPVVRYAVAPPVGESRHGDFLYLLCADGHMAKTRAGPISAGANAPSAKSPEIATGCRRPDLPGVSLPCAEGSGAHTKALTFSLR